MTVQNNIVQPSAKSIIDSLTLALMLTPNKNLRRGGDSHISAYGKYECKGKTVLIRVSDHNTFLYNWIERNQSVDLQMSANYAITFVDKVPFKNKPQKENLVNGPSPIKMTVRQYVYYCRYLTREEAGLIISACIQLAVNGIYSDPLEEDDVRHAIILRHTTNVPTKDLTAKVRKEHRRKKGKKSL